MATNKPDQKDTEERESQLCHILYCLYAGGCRIEDYTKVLLYLQSFVFSQSEDKKGVLENWTVPYIESLLMFFSELKKDSELMEANRNYIKY